MATTANEQPVTGWYLENTLPGHNKFYLVLLIDTGTVVLNWGRIDSDGQFKVQSFHSVEDAKATALRQVYAKRSSGYDMVAEEVVFTTDVDAERLGQLPLAFHAARLNPASGTVKAIFGHYDTFTEMVQKLLDSSDGRPFEDVWAEYEPIKAAWDELDAKHIQTAAALNLATQKLQQALMGGGS